jgi:uncharacterized protein YegL
MFGFAEELFGLGDEDRTDITVVLDRSGSMQAVYHQTVEGFESFVAKQKHTEGNCRMSLVQFDTVYQWVYRNKPIHKVPHLRLQPRGGTALLDAMGMAITETAARIERMNEASRPARVIVVIITDGMENSSREFTREEVFSLVRHYTDKADWQFVFLGANQDAIREATKMGIDSGAAMTYSATPLGTMGAWSAVGDAVVRHRASTSKRVLGSYFTKEERDSARK